MQFTGLLSLVFVCAACVAAAAASVATEVLHEWAALDFTFASESERQQWKDSQRFIVENCALTGIKAWKDDIYVTVPRWKRGVPATLARVVVRDGKPLLEPVSGFVRPRSTSGVVQFPSWQMNTIGDPNAFQYIQSMEIDTQGRMWVLDVGRLNIFDAAESVVNGPPKLVLLDLATRRVLHTFVFPHAVAAWNSSFLNDLAVDEPRGFAYISDASGGGGVVVYDLNRNRARRWSGPGTAVEPGVLLNISGKTYDFRTPTDGIALSPDTERLYYCPLLGFHLWSLPTKLLRDFASSSADISAAAIDHGKKASQTDGMAFDSRGTLYFGLLSLDGINKWTPSEPLSSQSPLMPRDPHTLQWVDTFGFDNRGGLLFTSNKLQLFFTAAMDFSGRSGSNFRILRTAIGADSYLVAQPPVTEDADDRVSRQTLTAVGVSVAFAGVAVGCIAAHALRYLRQRERTTSVNADSATYRRM